VTGDAPSSRQEIVRQARMRLPAQEVKETFYRQLDMPLDEAYAYASTIMVENMLHAEAEEGIGAFLEKRQPSWPR
jgi:enoyl-CoA hydratase/carnithine racemase